VKAAAKQIAANGVAQAMERAASSGKRLDFELACIAEGRVDPSALQQAWRALRNSD